MGRWILLCLAPFRLNIKNLTKNQGRERGRNYRRTLPSQAWYPVFQKMLIAKTISSSLSHYLSWSQRNVQFLGKSFPGGRDFVRESFRTIDSPLEAQEVMLSSISTSSWKQYESGLKKWWTYCCDKGIRIRNCPFKNFHTNTSFYWRSWRDTDFKRFPS